MGIYIVFAVGIGHFSSGKKRIEDHVHEINQRLTLLSTPTRVIDWYHSTASLVVRTPKHNRREIADELSLALGVSCTILTTDEAATYASIAEKADSPLTETGIRWSKGIAFEVKGRPCTVDLKPTAHATFFRISGFVVGVNRKETLTDKGASDKDDRGGGWGAVSDDIAKEGGGLWTARSLLGVKGVVEKARKHIG